MNQDLIQQLKEKGHEITIEPRGSSFGRGQIILKKEDHYECGTETRCDGYIAYE